MNKSFFTDNTGRVVLWQSPNLPLYGWILFKLAALVPAAGVEKRGFEQLSMAFLFIWAYLELTKGINNFRKVLGLIVLLVVTAGLFK